MSFSQSDPNNLVLKGNADILNKNYKDAEVEYRKAISTNKNQNKASHNLGNLLFENQNYDEAIQEYFKTQKNSEIDLEKHSAFHNLGNSYMKKKDYAQAVEAYKNALRNNSADDETRYNYALAKKFLEGINVKILKIVKIQKKKNRINQKIRMRIKMKIKTVIKILNQKRKNQKIKMIRKNKNKVEVFQNNKWKIC